MHYAIRTEDSAGKVQYDLLTVTVAGADDALTQSFASTGIDENSAENAVVGTLTLADLDVEDFGPYSVTLTGANASRFNVVDNANATFTIRASDTANFDHETEGTITLGISVSDGATPLLRSRRCRL